MASHMISSGFLPIVPAAASISALSYGDWAITAAISSMSSAMLPS